MPEEEKPSDASTQASTEEQDYSEILLKTERVPPEKIEVEREEEKPTAAEDKGKEEPAKEEKKEPPKPEQAKPEAPKADDEKLIQKYLDQFKGSPQELAKALVHSQRLIDRQGKEVGEVRKKAEQFDQLQSRIQTDREGVISELQQIGATEKEDAEKLVDQMLTDPEGFKQYLEKTLDERVQKVIAQRDDQAWVESEMGRMFTDYPQVKPQMTALREAVESGKVRPEELYYAAVKGWPGNTEQMMEDAKNLVRKEQEEALAAKQQEMVERQGAVTGEKEPEKSEEEIYQDHLLKTDRP